MRINTNITALNTFNSYTSANNKISGSVAKLSSGYAINNAADNAAGLAISEKMRAQVRGLDRASANSQDAISLIQTAEGNLKSSDEILQRMREIAVQSSSDVNENNIDREALQAEFSQLQLELDEIAEDASFNNQKLLNGNLASSKTDTSVSTKASGLTASAGKANAGSYDFKVSVKTTAAAVQGEAATVAKSTVTSSTVNTTYFNGTTAAGVTGVSAKESSLLNGNYKLEGATVGEDGSITVTAKGDNGQTFTAKLNKADYLGDSAAADSYVLNFGDDAFSLTFHKSAGLGTGVDAATTPTKSAVEDLASAFNGTEFTIAGGVDAKAAEMGVYASLTGAADVKLEAGMDSVTFDNGVTVSFDKLTSANLDTTLKTATSTAGSAAVTTNGVGAPATVAGINLADAITAGQFAKGAGTTYSVSFAGKEYSYVQKDGDTTDTITAGLAAAINADKATVANTGASAAAEPMLTLTASAAGTTINLTSQTNANAGALAADAIAWSAKSGNYDFAKVFSDSGTSEITVTSKANDGLTIQVGANTGDEMEINLERADAEYLGVKGLNVGTQDGASKAIDVVNKAINQVTSQRAYLGAMQNRLDYKIANLETSSQNLTSAESAIRDVDMAAEMTKFTNSNILSQASTAMLAQANTLPQNVLSLLG